MSDGDGHNGLKAVMFMIFTIFGGGLVISILLWFLSML